MTRNSNLARKLSKSPSEIRRALKKFSHNADEFTLPRDEIAAKFMNQWIAIYEGKIAAASDDLEELRRRVAAVGIPLGQAIFRHIDKRDKVFIL